MKNFQSAGHELDKFKEETNSLVVSYLTLRKLVGLLGMLLPFFLAVSPSRSSEFLFNLEPSISDYFFTSRGDILVVVLCLIGFFLLVYNGYTLVERVLMGVAGICAMGVAFAPTRQACLACDLSVHTGAGGFLGNLAGTWWHFFFAVVFFLSLAVISTFYFTRGKSGKIDWRMMGKVSQKNRRNLVYVVCGVVMVVCLLILAVYFIYRAKTGHDLRPYPVVYIFETVAVEAFGFSWLVKGEALWPDPGNGLF